jgi:hypothetical protein
VENPQKRQIFVNQTAIFAFFCIFFSLTGALKISILKIFFIKNESIFAIHPKMF